MQILYGGAASLREQERQEGVNCAANCTDEHREREAERGAHVLEIALTNRGWVVRECLGDSHNKPPWTSNSVCDLYYLKIYLYIKYVL